MHVDPFGVATICSSSSAFRPWRRCYNPPDASRLQKVITKRHAATPRTMAADPARVRSIVDALEEGVSRRSTASGSEGFLQGVDNRSHARWIGRPWSAAWLACRLGNTSAIREASGGL